MFIRKTLFLTLVLPILLLSSCSKYQKLLKGTDNKAKYDAGVKYYQNKDYVRAQALFEQLMSFDRGMNRFEKTLYYYAYSYYGQENYEEASYYFQSFVDDFPNSAFAEECLFMEAFCYYMDSPGPNLDQTNTHKAIDELQLFANKYPKSPKVQQCNDYIDILREKLQTKDMHSAQIYFDREEYKAAIVSYKNLIKEYPDTKYKEIALFTILKSNYLLAKNSIDSKKAERYQNTSDSYKVFIDAFPASKFIKEAESYYESSVEFVKKNQKT